MGMTDIVFIFITIFLLILALKPNLQKYVLLLLSIFIMHVAHRNIFGYS